MHAPEPATANWGFPTKVWFGAGRLHDLPAAVRQCGASRPLLVTDRGLAALPIVTDAVAVLRDAGLHCAVFSEVKPNPTGANIDAGVSAFRDGGHDLVIALGGGSGLDAGKAVALMARQTRPIWDFEDIGDHWQRVDTSAPVPVIAVPTTAGTGSELGRSSIVTDEARCRKIVIFHPIMLPDLVIMDPVLTTGLPRVLTAATGMDALAHGLEAYCSPVFHPMADGLALQALRMIREWLPRAAHDGNDLDARSQMLVASGMACVALQKGLGGMHALAHPLGAQYDAHHGMLNAVLMPYVLSHNMPVLKGRLADLARCLDLPRHTDTAVLDWVLELRETLNIPHALAGMGIDDSHAEAIVAAAVVDPCGFTNPIPLDPSNVAAIFAAALTGRL